MLSLWSANAGMKAIIDALNIAYDEEEKRAFVTTQPQSLAFTLGAIAFMLLALAAIVVLPIMLDFVGLGRETEWLIALARWPLLLAVVVAGLAVPVPARARAATKRSGSG